MSRDIFRRAVSWCVAASCFLLAVVPTFANSTSYTYDDLNRLKTIQYSDGTFVEYIYDEVGNRLQKKVNDTSPPVSSATPGTSAANTAISVTLSCSDGTGSGCNKIYYTTNGTIPTAASAVYSAPIGISATTTVKFFAVDNMGNAEAVKTEVYTIETTPPTGTVVANAGAAYANTTVVSLALACNDNFGACAQMQFSNDNVAWSAAEPYATSKSWTLATGDGAKTVYARFRDAAGNWSAAVTDNITLDATAPATTATPLAGYFPTAQTVSLTCSDVGGSGCNRIYYTTDGTIPTTASTVYTAPLAITTTTTLKYFATDIAGTGEAVKTQTYTIDAVPPSGTVNVNNGATYISTTASTLSLACSDNIGCSKMKFSNDNTTWSAEENYAATKAWTLATSDGVKTVYAQFRDAAGNWSATVSDTITYDITAPITTASPAAGSYNATKTVTLACSDGAGSGCNKIYYTIDGTTPTTASSVYSTPLTIAATTTLKFFATDLAGKAEAVKTQIYTFDATAPSGTASINAGATFSKSTSVTMSLTCTDNTACSTVLFSNDNVTWGTALTYAATKTWTMTSGDGAKTVYTKFRDAAGNESTVVNDGITLDTTKPVTTAAPLGGSYNAGKTVTLTCGDGTGSGCDKIYYTTDGTTPTTASAVYSTPLIIASTTTLKYFATDIAGNGEVVKSQTYTMDTIAPSGTITINAGGAFTKSTTATLTLTCTDNISCSTMLFSNDNVTWGAASTYAASKTWTLTSGSGTKTVYAKFRDAAGNESAVVSDTILLDVTMPATTASPAQGVYNTAQTVSLTCTDGTGSGCNKIYYTTNGTTPTTASTVYSAPISISTATTLKYFSADLATNSETVKTQTYTFDTTVPTGTVSVNAGAATTNSTTVTLNLTCTDTSGCKEMQFSNDNVNWSTAETYAATKSWTLTTGTGTKTVYAKFKDGAGNWTILLSDTIVLDTAAPDTTAPSGSISINAGAATTNLPTVTLTLSASDNVAVTSMNLSNNGTTWSGWQTYATTKTWTLSTGDGVKTVYVQYKDAAGNISATYPKSITLTTYDVTVLGVSTATAANITQAITVATTLKNQGGSATPGFSIGIYLSSDATITTTDTLIGSGSVTSIAGGVQGILYITARIPANLSAGTYYIGAIADNGSVVPETNETNNTLAGNQITTTAVAPDLSLTTVSGPTAANITQLIDVTTTTTNTGGVTAGFKVALYLSTDAAITTSDTFLGYVSIDTLAAGASKTSTTSVRVPAGLAAGTYYIGAIADSPDYVVEANEANNALAGNLITITAVSPDLSATLVSGPTSGNITQPITVATKVNNTGGATGGFYVSVYLSTDASITTTDTLLGYAAVTALAANTQTDVNTEIRLPSTLAAGTYYLGAIVDDGNNVAEVNETNNNLVGNQIAITATKPDLLITATSAPATGTRGQPISISSTVKNQGGTTGNFYVGIYLSTDATITASDTRIGYATIFTLASGASQTVSGALTIPAGLAAGTYYIGSLADDSNYVVESIETNNALAGNQITIN